MDTHDNIQSEYEVNRMMLTKYLKKHYRVYKIYLMNRNKPISVKNQLKFETFDIEKNCEINSHLLAKLLVKIFSVTETFAMKIIREIALEAFDREQREKIDLFTAFGYVIQNEGRNL